MLILGIDTATPQVGVAIGNDGELVGTVRLRSERPRHAEQLAPAIEHLCRELGVTLDHLAAIAVDIGPGLFTGLRVGVTTAKVMAQALRIPVIGVPSLDLLAFPARHADRLVVPIIDARRGQVYSAFYQPVQGGVQRVGDYIVASADDVAGELMARGEEALLVGDGARRFAACFEGVKRVELCSASLAYPDPLALLELAAARYAREEFQTPWDVQPLYLRKSDAELTWERERDGH